MGELGALELVVQDRPQYAIGKSVVVLLVILLGQIANSNAQWIGSKAPPQKGAGTIIEDEDTTETVEKIVAWLDERKLI